MVSIVSAQKRTGLVSPTDAGQQTTVADKEVFMMDIYGLSVELPEYV